LPHARTRPPVNRAPIAYRPTAPDQPLIFARFRLQKSQMKPAQSRLILPRINDA
jgi:hypothetical protein